MKEGKFFKQGEIILDIDGDEFNQTFKPIFTSGFDPFYYTFSIYNRFGNLIFESHDPAMGWDGSYNDGKTNFNCQVGTYVWTVEYNLYDLGAKNKVEGSCQYLSEYTSLDACKNIFRQQ